jgi:hypothetical protein
MMSTSVFLLGPDLVIFTGRSQKSKQIEALRRMAVPFTVNACGKPVVARAVVEGRKDAPKPSATWEPKG